MYRLKITLQKHKISTIINGLNEVDPIMMEKADFGVEPLNSPDWCNLIVIFNEDVTFEQVNHFMDELNTFKHQ